MMLCILSHSRDIYFNLAAEEYFLKSTDKDICMLWQSTDSVVVGKHQNAMAEVNYLWTLTNNIPVARRLTGGGTVYHGPGNLNFTFIQTGEPGKLIDFVRFVNPVIAYLKKIGISSEIGKRNDILVKDLKISGNAEHVYKNRVLHHGTLLFMADLDKLKNSLKVEKSKYYDKSVQSVRSEVSNIAGFLNSGMKFSQFKSELFSYLQQYFGIPDAYKLSIKEITLIEELRNEKYVTTDWIFGYSPPFEYSTIIHWQGVSTEVKLQITKGFIQHAQIGSSKKYDLLREIEDLLHGCRYQITDIEERLQQIKSNKKDISKFARLLF
jgi:lipoate-protein ligase A